jgi:mannosyltransferase OCH1-like enzyme
MEGLVNVYLEERIGAASDLVRYMVLYLYGGFYMDMDYFVRDFDNEMLYYFDSVQTRMLYYYYTVLNTYGVLIAPYHPQVKVYLDLIRNAHIKRGLE